MNSVARYVHLSRLAIQLFRVGTRRPDGVPRPADLTGVCGRLLSAGGAAQLVGELLCAYAPPEDRVAGSGGRISVAAGRAVVRSGPHHASEPYRYSDIRSDLRMAHVVALTSGLAAAQSARAGMLILDQLVVDVRMNAEAIPPAHLSALAASFAACGCSTEIESMTDGSGRCEISLTASDSDPQDLVEMCLLLLSGRVVHGHLGVGAIHRLQPAWVTHWEVARCISVDSCRLGLELLARTSPAPDEDLDALAARCGLPPTALRRVLPLLWELFSPLRSRAAALRLEYSGTRSDHLRAVPDPLGAVYVLTDLLALAAGERGPVRGASRTPSR